MIRSMVEWNLRSNVSDVLALGPRTAAQLLRLGVRTVEQLLVAKPHLLSVRWGDERVTWKTIACWQREAQLLLAAPDLGARAARILAVAEVASLQKLAQQLPLDLLSKCEGLDEAQRRAAGLSDQDLPHVSEVGQWIACAQQKNIAA